MAGEDGEYLEAFVRGGSEAAFRCLVERHGSWVRAAALRMVNGDAHLADDITQLVFVNLASKASSLPKKVVLAGWLHRDTRFTALEQLRQRRRQERRESEAIAMSEIQDGNTSTNWSDLRSELDAALDQLAEPDRQAFLLRYFEQRPLVEVGKVLGIREDAARKRVSRALDKLRDRLAAQGILTTAVALAAGLSGQISPPISASLVANISSHAVASVGPGAAAGWIHGILSLMITTKFVTVSTVVILALGIGALAPWRSRFWTGANSPISGIAPDGSAALENDSKHSEVELPERPGPAAPAADPNTAALGRLREVLHDPARGELDSEVEVAIQRLGGARSAAVALLREALGDPRSIVRWRSLTGIALMGPEAREVAPEIIHKLQTLDPEDPGDHAVNALYRIGPFPEYLSTFTALIRENPSARLYLANLLSELTGATTTEVANAVRPLLSDPDIGVSQTAASVLARAVRGGAAAGAVRGADTAEVVAIARRALDSDNVDARTLAITSLRNVGSDPKDPEIRVSAERLGPGALELVSSLTRIANGDGPKDQQHVALELLDQLRPDLRPANPEMDRVLAEQARAADLVRRTEAGAVPLPELIGGLQYPASSLQPIVEAIAKIGPDAQLAIPALKEAFRRLEPSTDTSGTPSFDHAERSAVGSARSAIAAALQQLNPEAPKIMFSFQDVQQLLQELEQPLARLDLERKKKVATAMQSSLSESGPNTTDLTPTQFGRLVQAIETVEPSFGPLLRSRMVQIDPHFAFP